MGYKVCVAICAVGWRWDSTIGKNNAKEGIHTLLLQLIYTTKKYNHET
jgi:hypothetical protein